LYLATSTVELCLQSPAPQIRPVTTASDRSCPDSSSYHTTICQLSKYDNASFQIDLFSVTRIYEYKGYDVWPCSIYEMLLCLSIGGDCWQSCVFVHGGTNSRWGRSGRSRHWLFNWRQRHLHQKQCPIYCWWGPDWTRTNWQVNIQFYAPDICLRISRIFSRHAVRLWLAFGNALKIHANVFSFLFSCIIY